jgi:ACT domain-containing protein
MMMIVDQSKCTVPFDTFSTDLTRIGEAKGVQVKCQREAIFDKMHRI